jgi:hypothetical protein
MTGLIHHCKNLRYLEIRLRADWLTDWGHSEGAWVSRSREDIIAECELGSLLRCENLEELVLRSKVYDAAWSAGNKEPHYPQDMLANPRDVGLWLKDGFSRKDHHLVVTYVHGLEANLFPHPVENRSHANWRLAPGMLSGQLTSARRLTASCTPALVARTTTIQLHILITSWSGRLLLVEFARGGALRMLPNRRRLGYPCLEVLAVENGKGKGQGSLPREIHLWWKRHAMKPHTCISQNDHFCLSSYGVS